MYVTSDVSVLVRINCNTHTLQLFGSANIYINEQEHYLLLADGFVLVYEITSKASYDIVVSIRQKIASKNKEV